MAKTPFSGGGGGLLMPAPHLTQSLDFSNSTWNGEKTHDLFDVSGLVQMMLVFYCTLNLAGSGATISFGVSGDIDIIVSYRTATTIDAGDFLIRDSVRQFNSVFYYSGLAEYYDEPCIHNFLTSQKIVYDIDNNDLSGGELECYCWWAPISQGATVELGDGS